MHPAWSPWPAARPAQKVDAAGPRRLACASPAPGHMQPGRRAPRSSRPHTVALLPGTKRRGGRAGEASAREPGPQGSRSPGPQGSGPGPPATLLRPCLLGAVTWMYSHHREVSFFSAPQNRRREISVVAENRRRGAAGTSPSAPASPSPAPRPPGGLAAGLFHVAFHWGGTGDGVRGGEGENRKGFKWQIGNRKTCVGPSLTFGKETVEMSCSAHSKLARGW